MPTTQISRRSTSGEDAVPIIYATDYGTFTVDYSGTAVGNNAAIIQAALDHAASITSGNPAWGKGAIVQLPAIGRLPMLSNLSVSGATWLRGGGPGLTDLYWINGSGVFIEMNSTNALCKISDLSVEDGAGTGTTGIYMNQGYTAMNQYGGDFCEVERVLVSAIGQVSGGSVHGIRMSGFENRVRDVYVAHTGCWGFFVEGSDQFLDNCTADTCATAANGNASGFRIHSSNCKVSNCKAFGGGFRGFHVDGFRNMFSTCEAQDNYDSGFTDDGSFNVFTSCIADSNGNVGFDLEDGSVAAGCSAMNRGSTPYTQVYSYKGRSNAGAMPVFTGCTSQSPSTAHVHPSSVGSIDVNAISGSQAVAYASSITPDPNLGGSVVVGTLTGTITVNAVASGNLWTGMRIGFQFTQDGTGHAVTFNTQYKTSSAISTAVNAVTRIQFEYDGTNFRETGRAVT